MPLVNTKQIFIDAINNHYAVGSFNVDSIAMVQAVLQSAEDNKSPIIIALSSGSRDFMHPGNIKDQISVIAKDITIPFAIHLDHGKSFDICKSCIDEGFTSVMIDASRFSYEENIKITKEVVEYAHKFNVSVEGELGGLDAINKENNYTNPKLVKDYITRTGVDSLAISIGTGHGTNKFKKDEIPNLRFDILEEIEKENPKFPLVLHGSSSIPKETIETFNNYGGEIIDPIGIPEELLQKAASMNIAKINIGTDFRMAYVGALRKSLSLIKDRYEPRNFLVPARIAAYKMVEYKINHVFMSAFKAQ